jgi:hypothetical protein
MRRAVRHSLRGSLLVALVAGALAACDGDDTPAGDAGPDDDGGVPPGEGLEVVWLGMPTPPAEVGEGVSVERIRLDLRDVRVIGDSAPGDQRTSKARLELDWHEGDWPEPTYFPDAPPGLYSKLAFVVQAPGDEPGLEVLGTVDREGGAVPFEIELDAALDVDLPIHVVLEPGGSATITVECDFAAALAVVDFDALPVEDGKLVLESGSEQAEAFLDALRISVEDGGE